MEPVKAQQVEWVKAVMSYLGVKSANALALLAGVNPANIQRPLSPGYKGKFGPDTIHAIARAANLRPMQFPNRPAGLGEADAVPYVFAPNANAIDANFDRAVRELTMGRNGRDPWVMRSYALETSGIMPGDVLIVDLNLQAQPKDIVCAQLYQWSKMDAETVFRVYEPPYLLLNSARLGTARPIAVDGNDVVIRGVVDGVLRRMRSAA